MHPSRFWNRRNFWSELSTKKVLMSSNFAPIIASVCSLTKSVFQSSRGLVQMEWGLEQECVHPNRCWSRRNYWSGLSTKKVLISLSNFALKSVSVCSFTKSVFQSSEALVQMEWGLEYECMHAIRCQNRRSYWCGLSRKKVLMSSNFAPIIVSVCSFTKSVFQSSRGLFQMEWGQE